MVTYNGSNAAQREMIQRFINRDLGPCQTALVCYLIQAESEGFSWEDIENLYQVDEDDPSGILSEDVYPAEVYEWWAIQDSYVTGKLRDMGEVILDNGYGQWWGRCCTGQAIKLDPTWWKIYQSAIVKIA